MFKHLLQVTEQEGVLNQKILRNHWKSFLY